MPHRIRDILLVASLYDSYILAEDGRLTEALLNQYVDLNLRYAPRVVRVSTGREALDALESTTFDLILTMSQLADMDVASFESSVREIDPELPVVMLLTNLRAAAPALENGPPRIDRAFLWSGDATIFLVIIKLLEDALNVEHDVAIGGVRVIILVEDSIRFASSYLPIIYTELMRQTQSLMAEGLNTAHRLLRNAARPKILLAQSYEQAEALFHRYRDNLLGVISDVNFPVQGESDPGAGLAFAGMIREVTPHLPILLQSSDAEVAGRTGKLKAAFLNKRSPTLHAALRAFMRKRLGFGDFVFRDPNDGEVMRAADLRALEKALAVAPEASLRLHARLNQFSTWLMARTEFELADEVRGIDADDFDDEDLRALLIEKLRQHRVERQRDIVAEFAPARYDQTSVFVKIGGGSLGGKGRGLAFVNSLIARYNIRDRFPGIRIGVPSTAVIAANVFEQFVQDNDLLSFILEDHPDEEIAREFLSRKLPSEIYDDLRAFLEHARYPLAIRSSSLLEDSYSLPFAGIYDTHFLPNLHANPRIRLDQLCEGIKLVYASTYFERARAAMAASSVRPEEEKMAVVVQQLVGAKRGETFYPDVSGVARSYNFYPYGDAAPEDGVAYIALGLGKTVVEGGRALRFCPLYPRQLPQFSTVDGILENAQRRFYALDVSRPERYPNLKADMVKAHGLDLAMEHEALKLSGSIYSPENAAVYDGVSRPGVPLVTFAHVLKNELYPLPAILRELLEIGRKAVALPVEIEFAARLSSAPGEPKDFGFLQIRPAIDRQLEGSLREIPLEDPRAIARSGMVLGHGEINELRDIILVDPEGFDMAESRRAAAIISRLNAGFTKTDKQFLLIGGGRWGSSDEWLGIPVSWPQISAARVIIELAIKSRPVEPSQGAHFFQNLTSFHVAYMTINDAQGDDLIDLPYLRSLPEVEAEGPVRHLRLPEDQRLEILIDGRRQRGVILRPE